MMNFSKQEKDNLREVQNIISQLGPTTCSRSNTSA
jgi:hypothetical protein